MIHFPLSKRFAFPVSASYGLAKFVFELLVIGAAYFVLAKICLTLAFVHPAVEIIWPPAGLALAAVLLRGLRVWPAIFVAALVAQLPADLLSPNSANAIPFASIIAASNVLAAIVGGYLINIWSDGCRTFDTPAGVAKFTSATTVSTLIGALVAAGGLSIAGNAEWSNYGSTLISWWFRDLIGALVIAPVIILWAIRDPRSLTPARIAEVIGVFVTAVIAGLLAWGPPLVQTPFGSSIAFLSALPILWAALRCGPRDTATVAFILTDFAIWGTLAGNGPFKDAPTGDFIPLTVFALGITITGLLLSAEIAIRNCYEARLRFREFTLRNMFNQAGVGVAQIDTTGRFILVNPQLCSFVQRPLADLLQTYVQDLAYPDERPQFQRLLEQAVDTREGFVIEILHALPNGTCIWLKSDVSPICDPSGKVGYLMLIAEDVTARRNFERDTQNVLSDLKDTVRENAVSLKTIKDVLQVEIQERKNVEAVLKHDVAERRKAQEALVQSEWRFRLFIQGVTDYAIFMLDPDGYITNWNTGAQRIHQYSSAEIVGQHFSNFYSEEERQRGEPARALQVAAYEGKHVTEGQYLRRDKSLFWASVVIEAIRDDAGTLVGFAEITRDITERREAQTSLERAKEQLAQSQKMEALGHLTGSIAHDFNNLLMIVSGHAQLLRRRLTDTKQLQSVAAMHSAANRGESLTRQLLAFSRRQPLNPVVTDLRERIDGVHEMLVGSLRGNIELKRDIADDVWLVEVDVAELELAMVNVAVNARDAMPGGGTITLSARNVTLKQGDGIDSLEGDHVALAMTDTGVGIAPDVLPRIFDPFFTTKPLGKGTGLGLSQVYGFSRQSGGTVVVTSTVGSGTTITIYLPRKLATLIKTTEAPPLQPFEAAQGTILIVEDNAEVAKVSTSLIEQLGYRTLRAENATDALNQLQRHEAQIDLVFSDIVMPGSMNGIALAQEIAHHYPRIPVLLTSGYSDVVQTAASQLPVLRKPFQLSALEKSIREALVNAGQANGDRVVQFPRTSASR